MHQASNGKQASLAAHGIGQGKHGEVSKERRGGEGDDLDLDAIAVVAEEEGADTEKEHLSKPKEEKKKVSPKLLVQKGINLMKKKKGASNLDPVASRTRSALEPVAGRLRSKSQGATAAKKQ